MHDFRRHMNIKKIITYIYFTEKEIKTSFKIYIKIYIQQKRPQTILNEIKALKRDSLESIISKITVL